ncbi:TPA: polysaccharide biosynthesis C-terminal domain-containing protein, partial [Escherichia coli]|nr:polysaccharide biosynthesis C-terminal domain-containing protein [Escherichia coli]
IIRAWCDTYAVLLQTMNSMKPLFIIVPIQALINFILQWYFISILSLTGILIGSIISFLCTVAIYLPYKFNQQIKKQTH